MRQFKLAILKLRHYEKVTKFEKNLPLVLTKQLFLLSSVKTSGRFFQIFVAFSEKLDFTSHGNKNDPPEIILTHCVYSVL